MSSQTRGDLESQIANLRKTIAAVTRGTGSTWRCG